MRVSVLIPTRNRRIFLEECVRSVQNQSHADLQILVSDDGSTDGTIDWMRRAEREDTRVKLLVDNPNPGIFTNMGHLVSHVQGEAFCLLGDDDRVGPSYIAELAKPLQSLSEVVATFCDHWLIDEKGSRLEAETDENSRRWQRESLPEGPVQDPVSMALAKSMCLGFSLYRSRVFQHEPFDSSCEGAADWDYAFRAADLGTLHYVKKRLAEYRVHPGTATSRRAYSEAGPIAVLSKRNFILAKHEQRRRALLREHLLQHALSVAPDQAWESVRALAEYIKLGGSPLDLKVGGAAVLAIVPRSLARRATRLLRGTKHP